MTRAKEIAIARAVRRIVAAGISIVARIDRRIALDQERGVVWALKLAEIIMMSS